jgi:hypothetical protein
MPSNNPGKTEFGIPVATDKAVTQLLLAFAGLAQVNFQLGKFAPVDPTHVTRAEQRRMMMAMTNLKPAGKGRWQGDPENPHSDLSKQRMELWGVVNKHLPMVLREFQAHHVDASAVYHFCADAGIIRRRSGPWDNLPANAALKNLLLHMAKGDTVPMPEKPVLSEREQAVDEIIRRAKQPITGPNIVKMLENEDRIIMDESTLRSQIIPHLKERCGLKSRRRVGYYY